ncbi:MAG: hypothetical protein IKL32_00025 [Alphaproteobacteria bacterium]|nr:hypothetical protein [Alphaproteobacteria bacterium]MBR6674298.1 hypothetical protein [Alphaproteobacteria bacterium]
MNIPTNYEFDNLYNAIRSPSTVHCRNTALVMYYTKYLFEKAISIFKFDGLLETWPLNYFQYVLFGYGYISVIKTEKYGVIPMVCGLSGYNVFYQPTNVVIANPLLQGFKTAVIGQECEIIKLQPNYSGIMDIVTTYADLMALCLETAGINLLNSKMSYIFFSENKRSAETFKKMYDKLASGEPIAVIDKSLINEDGTPTWELFTQNVGQNYITDKILNDMKTIEDRFNTDIGIPNANTQKRERMLVDEVNMNNVDTNAKIALWKETIEKDLKKVNAMYGLNISVDYRFKPEGGELAYE